MLGQRVKAWAPAKDFGRIAGRVRLLLDSRRVPSAAAACEAHRGAVSIRTVRSSVLEASLIPCRGRALVVGMKVERTVWHCTEGVPLADGERLRESANCKFSGSYMVSGWRALTGGNWFCRNAGHIVFCHDRVTVGIADVERIDRVTRPDRPRGQPGGDGTFAMVVAVDTHRGRVHSPAGRCRRAIVGMP
jgi:hypothetical protein